MENPKLIYLRSELNSNEYRCPITPQDVNKLITAGFTIYVEFSNNRIFDNLEYIKAGAIITTEPWYVEKFHSGLIIGLKDIPNLEKLRERLLNEIESLQNGTTSINQAKAVSNLANAAINSVMAEIMATKALPDNSQKALSHDYIDIEKV
jgi:alanine dehydrogenase